MVLDLGMAKLTCLWGSKNFNIHTRPVFSDLGSDPKRL